jgi:hypothetical protein
LANAGKPTMLPSPIIEEVLTKVLLSIANI